MLYRCPMCLKTFESEGPNMARCYAHCCGHFTVPDEDWRRDAAAWVVARDYEMGLLSPVRRERIVSLTEINVKYQTTVDDAAEDAVDDDAE